MVSVDGSLFIQIANFLILIGILNAILYKPIRNVLLQRKEKISGLEGEIDRFQKEAQEKADAFSFGIKDARVKGLKEKDAMLRSAADEEKKIIAKINEKAAAELANVREKIANDAENARKSLLKDVDVFAGEITQKILGRAV
jgi:F-type H+-transporting ATPase subunit b